MSAKRTVSVVIPCYNCEAYVGNAIKSVLKQDYSPLEVVVVDDGSTDDSLQEIRKFQDLIEIISTPNRGAPAARNTGLETATGSLVKFLDADDELFDGAIGRQAEQHAELGEGFVVFGEGVWFEESGRAFRRRFRQRKVDEDALTYVFKMNPQTSLSLYPKQLLSRVGGFDEALLRAQDLDLNLRICVAGGEHKYIPIDTTKIRMHDGTDRISNRSVLQRQPRSALNRLSKWTSLVNDHYKSTSRIKKEISHSAWERGRALLRADNPEVAKAYFDFAHKICKNPLAYKSKVYRVITSILGPYVAEKLAKIARNLGFLGNQRECAPTDNAVRTSIEVD